MINYDDIKFMRIGEVLKIIPVGRSTFYRKVKNGEYPKPYKLSDRISAWKYSDIKELAESIKKKNTN